MLIRNSIFGRLLALGLGLIFFNLSFLMLEAKLMGLETKNKQLYESMVRFVANGGCEEEKDTSSESTKDFSESEAKITTYITLSHVSNKLLTVSDLYLHRSSRFAQSIYLEIHTPPPKNELPA
jgi:uncharacterized membrane protein YgaE (UPF0421/DUF939 family)